MTESTVPNAEPDAGELVELTPEQNAEIEALPCRMFHTPPFDFAWCEVHDTTFDLGDVCKYQTQNQARKDADHG